MIAQAVSSVLVMLPDEQLPDYTLDRIERLLAKYFREPQYKMTIAVPGSATRYATRFGGRAEPLRDAMFSSHDTIVVSETFSDSITVPPSVRHYVLQHNHWHVFLVLRNQAVDGRDYPAIDTHAFNRYGPRAGGDHRQFFPYGFIFREPATGGPIDAYGFRIDEDLQALRARPAAHKVIAILGGSAAFSWYAFHDETFSERLEVKLQQHLDERGEGERVTVLNFGQGGGVILNEMITWLLHIERLRPEIVISHDGFNDLFWGMTNDRFLLDEDICAPHIFEAWGRILHAREDIPYRIRPDEMYRPTNNPRPIIHAFIERKKQLDRIVRASGSTHIAALQPYARSKPLSALEEHFLAQPRYNGLIGDMLARMPLLYEQAPAALKSSGMPVFDLHGLFGKYGAESTFFQDHAHTTPAGDEAIADAYFSHILEERLIA